MPLGTLYTTTNVNVTNIYSLKGLVLNLCTISKSIRTIPKATIATMHLTLLFPEIHADNGS